MHYKLAELEKAGNPIKVGIVGAGQMGRAFVSQLTAAKGMTPAVMADRTLEKVKYAFARANLKENEDYVVAETIEEAEKIISLGKSVATTNTDLAIKTKSIDCVADATGNPASGAKIAFSAIENGKHIIMMNVEADACIGPVLYKMAQEAEVVYTGMAGDEPAAAVELYDFAKTAGFEVRAIGKGKNNAIDKYCTPDSVREAAEAKGVNHRMFSAFVDGTNTMIELTSMANATGFLPDIHGAHGVTSDAAGLPKILSLKSEGGVLNGYGVVDYVRGIAPGVFAIISAELPEVKATLKYICMGDGPNYILYRPYHLTSVETPYTVARACLKHEATICPREGHVAEVAAAAKRDLAAGDTLEGIGGCTTRGVIMPAKEAKERNLLPVGLTYCVKAMKNNVAKDDYLTYDDVIFDEDSLLYKLRMKQNEIFK